MKRRLWTSTLMAAALAGCAAGPAAAPEAATCPGAAEIAAMVQGYAARQPVPNPAPTMTLEGAQCGARKFTAALASSQGRVVGYKAGLTNPAVQQRFGVNHPVRGTLFEKMLLKEGAEVPAAFGARPFGEADLLVEVASSDIHEARTPQHVLQFLRAVIPFIELPDLMVQDPTKVTGPAVVVINVGARLGVMGTPIPAQRDTAFYDALRTMTVRAYDAGGKELAAAPGAAILGHPLNAVLWLAADLQRDGITLKAGDLISLGSFSPPLPVVAGSGLRVVYDGLPGQPAVSVRFK